MRNILVTGIIACLFFSCQNNSQAYNVERVAPDFTLNTIDNRPIKLSEFYKNKKVVLIDFWASWCNPCRKENSYIVEAYQLFKDKGFDIIGVSLDDDRLKWSKAIIEDGITWTQISELKRWNSEVRKLYNVNSIPSNFLVDSTGKIIAVNLHGESLKEKLNELLK